MATRGNTAIIRVHYVVCPVSVTVWLELRSLGVPDPESGLVYTGVGSVNFYCQRAALPLRCSGGLGEPFYLLL